jgi:methionine-rich copper-binding protein CopC
VNERTPVPPDERLPRASSRPARRGWRLGALLTGLAAAFTLLPGTALAENSVVSSSPEDGASIGDSPAEIQITFAEELGEVNTMVVECNTELSTIGRPRVGDDGVTLSAEVVEPLPRGTCVVRWCGGA